MAAIKIPAPGTKLGPCIPGCMHQDCAENRATAAKLCPECKEPIGYERYFIKDETGADVHDSCLFDRFEKQKNAG